jgi:transcriptional regulator with XRE-family HTH domain
MAARSPTLQRRVAAWLASLRQAAGLTQDELAAKLGIATRNLQRIESGRQNLTLQTIDKIARAAGVDAASFFPATDDRPRGAPPSLFVVAPRTDARAPRPVPLLRLEAAAGFVKTGRVVEAIGWTLLPGAADERAFLAQTAGRSMEPLIPDRSWSLFRAADVVAVGRIGLFQVRRRGDPDDAGAFLLKRLAERTRRRVVLASANPAFAPVVLDEARAGELRVVAEWVSVVADR